MPEHDKSAARGRARKDKMLRRLRTLAMVAVIYSVYQYTNSGAISWPGQLLGYATATVSDYASRPAASWRRATDALEKAGASREGKSPAHFDLSGRVVRVADGDTVSVLDADNRQTKVRLYGIDTPERNQPYGNAAKRALLDLVSQQQVGVVVVTTDSYGRTVGTVYRDGENINLTMVLTGYAWWYQHYAPHEHNLASAQQQARDQRLGLWQDAQPVPPWEWRRGKR